jgi:hypothetical protein
MIYFSPKTAKFSGKGWRNMNIQNIFRQIVPASRLIGKRYTDADRANGGFGHLWDTFFQNNWFNALEKAGGKTEFDYLGMMRVHGGIFEYWIGMLFAPDAAVPQGFDAADAEASDYAVFWLYGNPDNGELYGMACHNRCLDIMRQRAWVYNPDGWCIERYNCPRFTGKDAKGNVILDYYIATI